MGYSPWGCKRVGHDLVAKQQQITKGMLPLALSIHSGPSLGTLPPMSELKLKYLFLAHRKYPDLAHL